MRNKHNPHSKRQPSTVCLLACTQAACTLLSDNPLDHTSGAACIIHINHESANNVSQQTSWQFFNRINLHEIETLPSTGRNQPNAPLVTCWACTWQLQQNHSSSNLKSQSSVATSQCDAQQCKITAGDCGMQGTGSSSAADLQKRTSPFHKTGPALAAPPPHWGSNHSHYRHCIQTMGPDPVKNQ